MNHQRRHRQPAQQAAGRIADSLSDQFPVDRGTPPLNIEMVDRLQIEHRLQRCDQRQNRG